MLRFQQGNLLVRDLTEKDSTLLLKWLSDASVLEFYDGRDRAYDLDKVKEHFYNDDKDEYRCIVEYDRAAIGYIQFYPISEKERQEYGYDQTQGSVFGMDQFIGEPEYWNRGIGSLLVSATRDYITSLGVNVIVMDPQTWNHRALRCYEKCGFVRKRLLPQHEWHEGAMRDCWLIEYKNKNTQLFYFGNCEAPKPNKPPSIGVVAIIKMDDSILLEKRSNSERWAIIGGGINTDETFVEGLIREVREETGLTVKNIKLFGTFSDPSRIIAYPDGNVRRIITLAYEVEVEPFIELVCSEESSEIRFIPTEQLSNIHIAETHLPIIHAYLNDKGIVLE